MKQKLLLLFLAATFSLKAQTKVKFSPAQFAGTWKCIAQQWDSAGKKITRKETSRYTYSFSPKGDFTIVFDCTGCPTDSGGRYVTRGTWKLNTRSDSIVFTAKQGSAVSTWADKIVSVNGNKMAIISSTSEIRSMILVFEKQALTAAGASTRTEIVPKE